ncbi:MAG TPA: hypothetical protein VGJ22_06680 [Anaerolineales bacterium]|jgi:hypothetical protein
MNRRIYLLLFFLALIVQGAIASLQKIPGYLDADYYFAGGLRLVRGYGFTENYLWNYLDDPQGLPHPSHGYWMPLASILAAAGMWVTGQQTYAAARLGFILLAAAVPPLTANLAHTFAGRRELAIASGLLAIFSVFHLTFMPVTDNYAIYMILGGLYFLVMQRPRPWFWLGLLAGLMTLARTDGLIWLALTLMLAGWQLLSDRDDPSTRARTAFRFASLVMLGYLSIMGPWYARNLSAYGSLMSPGGSRTLWLTTYDETFVYPVSKLTMQSWLASGWPAIFKVRLWAFSNNVQTMIAAHAHLILFPFIVAGMWQYRTDRRVQVGLLAWFGLFIVMTFVFPFAGVRGSFFHAGAALQPLFWSLAPVGLESAVSALGRRRGWAIRQAQTVFRFAMVQMVVLLSAYLVWVRVFEKGWGEGENLYPSVEQFLVGQGIQPDEPVMVLNSPAYYLVTGRPAVVQPYGDPDTTVLVAKRFGVRYFVFESAGQLKPLKDLYQHPLDFDRFHYLGEVDGARIFEIDIDD